MPTDWGGGAGADIGRTLIELGRIRGENSVQQGNIWGHAIANIGNTIENAPLIQMRQQEMQARAAELQGLAQDRQLKAQQMQSAQAAQAKIQQLASDPTLRDESGQLDLEKFSRAVAVIDPRLADSVSQMSERLATSGKTRAQLAEEQRKLDDAHRDRIASALGDAQSPEEVQIGLAALHNVVPDSMLQQTAAAFDQYGVEGGRQFVRKQQAMKPPSGKTREVKVTNPDGTETISIVEDKAGQTFTSAGKRPDAGKPGSFEDYVTRYAQSKGKPVEQLSTADIEDARKRYGQADDKATSFAASDQTKLSPSAIDLAALNYRKTGVMPPLGMGDKSNRQAILNRAATLTPEDITRIEAGGGDIAANKAGYGADSASLKKLQQQRDAISSFENTAKKNIDLFLQQAGKVVDTGSPLANTLARAVSGRMLGSPDQAAYDAARQVALSEIAKIVNNPNLSGTLSDSARKEIEAFNPNSATLKQSVAVMRLLQQDMTNRATSLDEQLGAIKGRLSGGAAAPKPATPAAGGPTLTYQDYLKAKGGK